MREQSFAVKCILVGTSRLNYFAKSATNIVEFEVGPRNRAGVLLVRGVVLSINTFVVGKVNVVALGIRVYRQVVVLTRVGQGGSSITLGRSSPILVVGHFVTV